jgi:hypothetical protein
MTFGSRALASRVLVLLLVCMAAGSYAAQIPAGVVTDPSSPPSGLATSPADPEMWREFLGDWAELKANFLEHIKGARNISIPIAPNEFDWKVDWEAQQRYCRRIADAIFGDPQRIDFPLPDVMAVRDGVAATYEALGRAFPKCVTPRPGTDEMLRNIVRGEKGRPTRRFIDFFRDNWRPEKWRGETAIKSRLAYLIGDDYVLKYSYDRSEPYEALTTVWWAHYRPDPLNGCPSESKSGPTIALAAVPPYAYFRPSILIKVDDHPVPVDFGTYSYPGTEDMQEWVVKDRRWGRAGQKYLVVRSLQHDFWRDWALGALPPEFKHEDENHTRTGLYSACFINFDTAAEPPAPSNPLPYFGD